MQLSFKSRLKQYWLHITSHKIGRLLLIMCTPLLLGAVWYQGIYTPLQQRIQGLAKVRDQLYKETMLAANKIPSHDIAQEYLMYQKKWDTSTKQFAATQLHSTAIPNIFGFLHKYGLQLQSYTVNDPVKKDWYKSERVLVCYTGPTAASLQFLQELPNLPLKPSCRQVDLAFQENNIVEARAEIHFLTVNYQTS